MNLGLILALAAVGQAAGSGWQPSDWPRSVVTPSQYTVPANEVSPGAAARYGTPQYAPPAAAPQSNYDYSGQTRWPTIRPTPQPAVDSTSQPMSQFTNPPQYDAANTQPAWPNQHSQPRTADTRSATTAQQQYWQQQPIQAATQQLLADSKAALAAEYQAQVDDRWSFYSDFYRQPNPQLPTIPAQQPTQPQNQYQSGGAAVVNQPNAAGANLYGNNYTQPNYSQPNYSQPNNQPSQLTLTQQTQTQPKNSQPNYNQPTYSQPNYNQQQAGSGTHVAQQPSGWPNNAYQPQSQPQLSNTVGPPAATIADNRGAMTLQPPLNSTLPAGADNRGGQNTGIQQPDFAPTPRYNNSQTAWNNGNAGNVQDNSGVGQPRVDSTATLNPPTATANTGFKSSFPALPSNTTTSAPKSNLLSSLTPKSSPQYNQPLGSGKGGSGLFASASLGKTSEGAAGRTIPVATASGPGACWWRRCLGCSFPSGRIFISAGSPSSRTSATGGC